MESPLSVKWVPNDTRYSNYFVCPLNDAIRVSFSLLDGPTKTRTFYRVEMRSIWLSFERSPNAERHDLKGIGVE